MKLTARVKRKTSPMTKQVRRSVSGRGAIIIDPMGDSAFMQCLYAETKKAGRARDFFQIKPSV